MPPKGKSLLPLLVIFGIGKFNKTTPNWFKIEEIWKKLRYDFIMKCPEKFEDRACKTLSSSKPIEVFTQPHLSN